jgi:hypothetical protein
MGIRLGVESWLSRSVPLDAVVLGLQLSHAYGRVILRALSRTGHHSSLLFFVGSLVCSSAVFCFSVSCLSKDTQQIQTLFGNILGIMSLHGATIDNSIAFCRLVICN